MATTKPIKITTTDDWVEVLPVGTFPLTPLVAGEDYLAQGKTTDRVLLVISATQPTTEGLLESFDIALGTGVNSVIYPFGVGMKMWTKSAIAGKSAIFTMHSWA